MATPDATAQIRASDQRVLGDAGLVGGSPPRVRRHVARSSARVAEPAAMPLTEPTAFQRSRRSAITHDSARDGADGKHGLNRSRGGYRSADHISLRGGGPSAGVSLTGSDNSWRSQARCLGTNPELFFPLGGTGRPLAQAEMAKAMCLGCPVRQLCLKYALETNQVTGVWGGTTEDERRAIRRKWVRAGRPNQLV
jgi:WhiB family redox-sensing transcriptional regulator